MKFTLRPYQIQARDDILRAYSEGCTDVYLDAPTGSGKRLDVDTPVLTPTGWVRNGDLVPGDTVTGRDGTPTRVTGVYDHGTGPAYNVTFNDGTSVIADPEHLWSVQTPHDHRQRRARYRTMTTQQLLDSGLTVTEARSSYRWFLPLADPVQHAKTELPLDPYLLGVFLANGSAVDRHTSVTVCTNDDQISDRYLALASDTLRFTAATYSYSTVKTWRLPGFRDFLRPLGLSEVKSDGKFIPDIYLTAAADDRLALLHGLMDCDGTAPRNRRARYDSRSKRLAEGVAYLVRSLGGVARVDVVWPPGEDTIAYSVPVWLPVNPFSLARKADSYRPKPWFRAIASITPVAPREMRCIAVDAPDHLYVVNDFIVTHNTVIAMSVVEALRSAKSLYVPADKILQSQFQDSFPDIPLLMGHRNYCRHLTESHTTKTADLVCDYPRHETYEFSPSSYVTHRVRRHDDSPHDPDLRALCEHASRRLIADAAPMAQLNPWKLLHELPRYFSDRDLVVIDEADSLDSAVDEYLDASLSLSLLERYDWFDPGPTASTEDHLTALRAAYKTAQAQLNPDPKALDPTRAHLHAIAEFGAQTAHAHATGNAVLFVSTETPDLILRLISPAQALADHAWARSRRRLHMTGSFGADPLHWARHMGLPIHPSKARVIKVPHQFPVQHRTITVDPVAEMNAPAWQNQTTVQRLAAEIRRLHTLHDSPRTLVHVTSRAQADALAKHIPSAITYTQKGENREKAIAQLGRRPHAILIAHSCHRGVDLVDDLCRLNIVAKLPYINLDRSTKARQAADPNYYAWATASKLVQSLGRAVRGPDDWCDNYILDASFSFDTFGGRQLLRQLPDWVREALRP